MILAMLFKETTKKRQNFEGGLGGTIHVPAFDEDSNSGVEGWGQCI